MKKYRLIQCIIFTVIIFLSLSAKAQFIGRLETSPGSGIYQAYYDTQLNITWAANANIVGARSLFDQYTWANNLTINSIDGWRLPNMDINDDRLVMSCTRVTQAECKDNEYGHLFYYGAGTTLGEGITAFNPGPFSNVQFNTIDIYETSYWSPTPTNHLGGYGYPGPGESGWLFNFETGEMNGLDSQDLYFNGFAWAVHSGDVGSVPLPAAVWLFVSGLVGLSGIARYKRYDSDKTQV